MHGKLIVIEGTDCSGKETQTKLAMEKLKNEGIEVVRLSFPNYDSPTGKIVGGPYLGKSYISEGWFEEGATNVDSKVASLYYAADRKYNIPKINEYLENGVSVVLDRYTFSNMAHQGGKIIDSKERTQMYNWIHQLEFELLELPFPEICVFLHMPYEGSCILKAGREEAADQHEADADHLKHAEQAYLEIANKYNFKTIECIKNKKDITRDTIRTITDINDELFDYLKKELTLNKTKTVK